MLVGRPATRPSGLRGVSAETPVELRDWLSGDRAFLLVDIGANMIHERALTAFPSCVGRLYATTLSEGGGRFIPIYPPYY